MNPNDTLSSDRMTHIVDVLMRINCSLKNTGMNIENAKKAIQIAESCLRRELAENAPRGTKLKIINGGKE